MEDQIGQETQRVSPPTPTQSPAKKKTKSFLWIVIIIVALLIMIVLGYMLLSNRGEVSEEDLFPTPTYSQIVEQEPTATPTPPKADKTDLKVQVLNGSGVAGEAAYAKTQIEKLGYTSIETGNADKQDQAKTLVTFSSDIPQDLKDELVGKLEEIYSDVDTSTGSTGNYDIKVVIGLRKGQKATTPTPTTKAATTLTPTKSPTTTPTTATVTPTKTPTPTTTPTQ